MLRPQDEEQNGLPSYAASLDIDNDASAEPDGDADNAAPPTAPDPAPPPMQSAPTLTPPAAASPAPAAPKSAQPDLGGFESLLAEAPQTPVHLDVGPPPMRGARDSGPLALAALGTALVGRGNGTEKYADALMTPDDVAYDNWKRQYDYAHGKAQIEEANRHHDNPLANALRLQALALRRDALEQAGKREARLGTAEHRKNDPEAAARLRQLLIDMGEDPKFVEGMTLAEMQQAQSLLHDHVKNSQTMRDAAAATAAEKAAAEAAATLPAKKELVGYQAAVAPARAGAEAEARLPSEKELADYHNQLSGKPPPSTATTDDVISEWEREHPGMYVDSAELFRRNRLNAGRGEVKARGDEQQAARLMAAVGDMQQVMAERKATPVTDVGKHYELKRKYDIAQSKATGALSELSHNNTEHGRELDASKLPSYLNPDAPNMLRDAREIYSDAAGAIMSTYGVKIGNRPAGSAPAPAAPATAAGNLGVTQGNVPKVDHVIHQPAPAKATKPKSAQELAAEGWE